MRIDDRMEAWLKNNCNAIDNFLTTLWDRTTSNSLKWLENHIRTAVAITIILILLTVATLGTISYISTGEEIIVTGIITELPYEYPGQTWNMTFSLSNDNTFNGSVFSTFTVKLDNGETIKVIPWSIWSIIVWTISLGKCKSSCYDNPQVGDSVEVTGRHTVLGMCYYQMKEIYQ